MPYYNYLFLMLITLLVIYFIRYQLIKRKNSPFQLYNEALQNENKGNYKEALVNYELALAAAEKVQFFTNLKNRIHEKRKLLNTIIEYENNIHQIHNKETYTDKRNSFIKENYKTA